MKGKAETELHLVRDIKDNKEGFCKDPRDRRHTQPTGEWAGELDDAGHGKGKGKGAEETCVEGPME